MPWSVHLTHPTTGELGPSVDPTSGSWSIELNKTESGSITVPKARLRQIEPAWWNPGAGGVVYAYHQPNGTVIPWVAGVITGWPDETDDNLTLDWSGPRKILSQRIITEDLKLTGMSLGTIAWEIVKHLMARKPAGGLPIVHGTDEEDTLTGADHTRTYDGWNVSNNDGDKRLTELSGVENGPDIMFRPRWTDDTQRAFEWVMVHGTEGRPPIAQTWYPDFDTTGARSGITDVKITSSADAVVNRVWATGAGEGAAVARTYAEDLSSLRHRVPFTERVITDNDQADTAKLLVKAKGELAASLHMVDQVDFSTRADSPKYPLGSYFVGDNGLVTMRGWIAIPDGTRPMRILKMSGNLDEKISLSFQSDQWD